MVWISGGIAVLTQGAQDRWVNSYSSQVRGLAQRLATQGITVYPVQATGLQVGILGTNTTAQGSSKGQDGEMQASADDEGERSAHLGHDGRAGRHHRRPLLPEHQRSDGRRARGGHRPARRRTRSASTFPRIPTTGGASSTFASAVRAFASCIARDTWRSRQ